MIELQPIIIEIVNFKGGEKVMPKNKVGHINLSFVILSKIQFSP